MITLILGMIFGLIFTVFSVQNTQYMTINFTPQMVVKMPVYFLAVIFMFLGSLLAITTPPLINYSNKLSGYINKKKNGETEEKTSKRGRPTKEEVMMRDALLKKEKKQKAKPRVEKTPRRFFKGIPAAA